MGICGTLKRQLSILTYTYLNVDECWLTYSMHKHKFKLHIYLKYAVISENVVSEIVVFGLKALKSTGSL